MSLLHAIIPYLVGPLKWDFCSCQCPYARPRTPYSFFFSGKIERHLTDDPVARGNVLRLPHACHDRGGDERLPIDPNPDTVAVPAPAAERRPTFPPPGAADGQLAEGMQHKSLREKPAAKKIFPLQFGRPRHRFC